MIDTRVIFEAWLDRNYPTWQHEFDVEEITGRLVNIYIEEENAPEFDFNAKARETALIKKAIKRPQLQLM